MSTLAKGFALLFTVTCCSTLHGQLVADISLVTTSEADGRLRYEYLVDNLPESEVAINAFILDVGAGADIQSIEQPVGWIGDYDPAEDPFELAWVTQTPQAAIPIGGNGGFSFTSPLQPGEVDFYLANLGPDGSDLGSILDTVKGPLVAPPILSGDYSDNGRVEQADLDLVLLHWGNPFVSLPGEWINQRPDMGIVDQAELDGVLLNWGNTADLAAAVPEPSSLVLLACCAAAASSLTRKTSLISMLTH